eukprot:3932574-Rhodomonas_salina.1
MSDTLSMITTTTTKFQETSSGFASSDVLVSIIGSGWLEAGGLVLGRERVRLCRRGGGSSSSSSSGLQLLLEGGGVVEGGPRSGRRSGRGGGRGVGGGGGG